MSAEILRHTMDCLTFRKSGNEDGDIIEMVPRTTEAVTKRSQQ